MFRKNTLYSALGTSPRRGPNRPAQGKAERQSREAPPWVGKPKRTRPCKGETTMDQSHTERSCFALSGLDRCSGLIIPGRCYALPWADLLLPRRGEAAGAIRSGSQFTSPRCRSRNFAPKGPEQTSPGQSGERSCFALSGLDRCSGLIIPGRCYALPWADMLLPRRGEAAGAIRSGRQLRLGLSLS